MSFDIKKNFTILHFAIIKKIESLSTKPFVLVSILNARLEFIVAPVGSRAAFSITSLKGTRNHYRKIEE